MKGAIVFTSFGTPADWLLFGDIEVDADDRVQLTNIDLTIIRANDFSPVMPVLEYPAASGNYVGNPNRNVSYLYNLPDEPFGNYHSLTMEGLIPTTLAIPGTQQLIISPRNASYFQEDLGQSVNYHRFSFFDGGGRAWLDNADTTGIKYYEADEWFRWQIEAFGKWFMNVNIVGTTVGGAPFDPAQFIFKGQWDEYPVNPTTPQGLIMTTTQWTQGNTHIRSPGKEYEDTVNPAVLRLMPFKSGFVLPDNSANKYVEVTTDMRNAIIGGTAEIYVPQVPQNVSRFLCTCRISNYVDFDPIYILTVFDAEYDLGDGIISGGYITFPDYPTINPKRILFANPAADNQIPIYENLPQALLDAIDADERPRVDIWTSSVVPIWAGYPINETNPLAFPLPFTGDLTDIRGFDSPPPSVGDRVTFGVWLNNFNQSFIEEDYSFFCKEILVELNPIDITAPNAPTITVVNDLTGTSFTCTIDGDVGATHYLLYKKTSTENWTLWGTRVDDGDIQVTGLDIARYDVIVYSFKTVSFSPPSNHVEIIVSTSSYTSIHELLYQLIKGDGTFQSLTGATGNDARIYYFHPPEDIELSNSKPAYVTYFEESGAGIEDDRVYLAGEGDLIYRFDVWANNFDNMLAVWKAMRDIFNYLYYQYTGERLIKQIKLLSEAELFEQDTRIYRKSGTFLVRFIWQIQ